MKVDIWSDIRCPFCYIGKRKFEQALEQFENREDVVVTWHSFQLDANLKTQPEVDLIDYFTKAKGISREQAHQMFSRAKEMAAETGLEFNMDSLIVANSYKSHQLLQFAKSKGLGDEIKEALFEAHFTEGKNIDDRESLIQIAAGIGLDKKETEEVLDSEKFAYQVKQDEMEARNIGVQGVPFFVFNNKYAVSGAQAPESFLEVLEKSWKEETAL
ncbi:DsbA family oxidoreductase [Gillisia limnaea]|uniref:DSBA oxidoreductase n=1 Tax=Gillisia limnaea (strain DSM 15749 / LMG 21470 / R-8282) TaxID=865937 RepID=H2BSX1_GILLR|nr:DsbA family oxidoreductase [Gillisia limnaea]EHQ01501.1 DSBA oxidoreductase [Gillisia limnaea DSM 15749]